MSRLSSAERRVVRDLVEGCVGQPKRMLSSLLTMPTTDEEMAKGFTLRIPCR